MYVPKKLQVYTRLVYKGTLRDQALDENQTKAINLPEPFVSRNEQRDFFYQKALISKEFRVVVPSKKVLFLPWQSARFPYH